MARNVGKKRGAQPRPAAGSNTAYQTTQVTKVASPVTFASATPAIISVAAPVSDHCGVAPEKAKKTIAKKPSPLKLAQKVVSGAKKLAAKGVKRKSTQMSKAPNAKGLNALEPAAGDAPEQCPKTPGQQASLQ